MVCPRLESDQPARITGGLALVQRSARADRQSQTPPSPNEQAQRTGPPRIAVARPTCAAAGRDRCGDRSDSLPQDMQRKASQLPEPWQSLASSQPFGRLSDLLCLSWDMVPSGMPVLGHACPGTWSYAHSRPPAQRLRAAQDRSGQVRRVGTTHRHYSPATSSDTMRVATSFTYSTRFAEKWNSTRSSGQLTLRTCGRWELGRE